MSREKAGNSNKNTSSKKKREFPGGKQYCWKEGQSGNPNGRPKGSKGFAAMIREKTLNGKRLLEEAFKILDKEDAKDSDKLTAIKWLADRAFGQALQTIENIDSEEAKVRLDLLSDEEVKQLHVLSSKFRRPA